jgi:hypothetical protein
MRIAQIVLPNASAYERKSQRIDQAGLRAKHEVMLAGSARIRDTAVDVVHFYGKDLAAPDVRGLAAPWVASAAPRAGRFSLRKPPKPRYVFSPLAAIDPEASTQNLPEAVEEIYFSGEPPPRRLGDRGAAEGGGAPLTIGSYFRPSLRNIIDQTLHRLERTRDDLRWKIFDTEPTPDDLRNVDVWVDPAVNEDDFDGFVAEAVVAGISVVASRTTINAQRLEKGRTGFLVPPRDPNELTHAILAALFKSEVAELKIEAARQTAGKFRPRQRLRVLERIYETLVP